jgi:DNA polymerase (family 10)
MLGKRAGIDLHLDHVFDAAAETGTAIEINASLRRLDASVEAIREGARRGVTFVISTDAHAVSELERARFGVAHARRAGLDRSLIANTWDRDRFLAWCTELRSG